MQRVVVTGIGPVSSIGIGIDEFRDGLRAGRSGAAPIRSFDTTGFPHVHACEVYDFRPSDLLENLDVDAWGRTSLFAAAAARLAVRDGRLDLGQGVRERAAAVIGTTVGESQVIEEFTGTIATAGYGGLGGDLLSKMPGARLAHAVSTELGITGESMTIATACSASNHTIGFAYDLLVGGDADVAVAGGADSVCRWAHAGFYRLGALAERACTPFDRDRQGILTGEGGSALLLETLDHARGRGARIYAEVLGYGLNCDADHMVAPNRGSIAECIRQAHFHAGVKPADVDYICAHGTGTPTNDQVEAGAIFDVFGPHPPPVSSIKSMIGHTMGAASAFGAIASILAIHEGFLPPTINFSTPDPDFAGLDPVPLVAREQAVRVAQNNGFAFGGNNAITIFGAAP